jgi:hypothetical protein
MPLPTGLRAAATYAMLPAMSEPDEYVAIEYAGQVTGVPARTLRRWAAAGRVPVMAGQRKRLVRLADVRRLADATGHRPASPVMTGEYAGHTAGQVAEELAEPIDVTAPAEIPAAARAQLAAIRDEFVAPLVEQIREQAERIGRLEAERDALWATVERLEAEQEAAQTQNKGSGRAEIRETAVDAPISTSSAWGRFLRWLRGPGERQ